VTELQVASRTHEQQYLASFALQQVGHKLLELDTVEELAAYICRRAHDLCGADRAVLYLLHHDQTAEIVALNGWDGRWLNSRVPFEALYPAGDISDEHARFESYPPGIPKRAADIEGVLVRAGLRVPLIAQREVVGAMIFHSTIRKEFDTRESALLHALANAGAAAIQRADLIDSLRDKIEQLERAQKQIAQKERLERELELARTVQQNMLPHQFPLVAGAQFYARSEPARQVGGDFYDVFLLDAYRIGVVIADVSDKGMPAALFMALTRSLVRAEAQRETSPERVLRRVHRLLLDVAEPTQFVTIFYGVLDVAERRLRYVRAGHDYPLLIREGAVLTLRSPGTILGLVQENELILNEEDIELKPCDRLVLYTDGITDAINSKEEQFDRERLQVAAVEHYTEPLDKMGDAIFQAVAEHQGDAEPFDDMTLLVVGIN
jgi:serine phosphatase RsbU (regulator of sigma subunit)